MNWHLIKGEAGCAYARENNCVAVVVDALRAGATCAMLFDSGASEILVVRTVEDAYRARKEFWPDALLVGERNNVPPEGFDLGNSPRETETASGRRVVFTTSNGAERLFQAQGAVERYLASNLSGLALVQVLARHGHDVALIPAGLVSDPDEDALEDWVAATSIAMLADANVVEGALVYRDYRHHIELDGSQKLFESAHHAQALRDAGFAEDVAFCARNNVCGAVPRVAAETEFGLLMQDAAADAP